MNEARKVLDEDHYGLEDIKERILESLAVVKLSDLIPRARSYFSSALRELVRHRLDVRSLVRLDANLNALSLGGMRDEAELRGHRRTYIGAMPGRIIQALRRVGVNNPVMMLDEVDKLGNDFRGDPASALLEILRPGAEQHFPRQLSRPAVRSIEGVLHRDRKPTRADPDAAA